MPFVALREVRELARKTLQATSVEDCNMLIDLAAAQQLGECLTMKQLVLLQCGTATTVRRQVNRLIEQGLVVKLPNAQDKRSDLFGVAPEVWVRLEVVRESLLHLHEQLLARMHQAGYGAGISSSG
jgi:hypothetical protein